MLDVTKIGFEVRREATRVHHVGKVLLGAGVDVNAYHPDADVPIEVVQERIKQIIWDGVYGDLRQPLNELRDWVFRNVAMIDTLDAQPKADRASELFGVLSRLLECPKS